MFFEAFFHEKTLQRTLDTELEEHIGYKKHSVEGKNTGNSRNGKTKKLIKGEFGEFELETPRDRNGSFQPAIIKKNQTRFDGFDDKILALYAKGMTTMVVMPLAYRAKILSSKPSNLV